MAKNPQHSLLSALDFCIELFKEQTEGKGEDSYFYSVLSEKAVFGVFDGCGGSGARRYERLQNRTGAYMASRVVSGAVRDWFDSPASFQDGKPDLESLTDRTREYLAICQREGYTPSPIKGTMSKAFPTTAAVIACTPEADIISAVCIWAGDSRCYKLDETGLMQLTDDDISGFDAMENLSADGGLTNVISASSTFKLHQKRICLTDPCLLFAATDGCFGYLNTPMEFEYLLLNTLRESSSVREWEKRLEAFLQTVAGDDFTLCGCSLGFETWENLQNRLRDRETILLKEYINGIETKTVIEKTALWHRYAGNYSRYLKKSGKLSEETAGTPSTPAAVQEGEPRTNVSRLKIVPQQKNCEKEKGEPVSEPEATHRQKGFRKPEDLD